MLDAWSIDINSLYVAIWCTTAVNSGVDHGACTCIEREKETALLWCFCRHHTAEVHLTYVFIAIQGPTTGYILVISIHFCDINVSDWKMYNFKLI